MLDSVKELRILAHLSEEPALIESFGRGEDIHTRTASEVFKVPAASVTRYTVLDPSISIDPLSDFNSGPATNLTSVGAAPPVPTRGREAGRAGSSSGWC